MTMTELKPCPFCDGEIETKDFDFLASHLYRCKKCKSGFILQPVTGFSAEDVWNMKNTKYFPSEVQQAIERMKPVVIKPKLLDEYHPDGSVYLIKCENCKQEYKLIGFEFSSEIQHCRKCGQAQLLDWDEDGRIDTALQKP